MKKFLLLLLCGSPAFAGFAQTDTVMYQRDSVVELEGECDRDYFTRTDRISDPSKITLVAKNGRAYSMPNFLKAFNIGGFSESGLSDLDGDGKKELLISNFTGGAHCCDELYIFRPLSGHRYQYVAKPFAGHLCFLAGHRMVFSFYEHFGYFHTCYACSFTDTSVTAPLPVMSVELYYEKGRLKVKPGDAELRSLIRDNLGKLSEQPYQDLDSVSQDNGLRKEFALNLAVYYYSFGRSLAATRKLFDEYYRFPDAARIWNSFREHLSRVRKLNDF